MQERCNRLKSTLAPLTVVKWPEMRESRYGMSYSFQFVDIPSWTRNDPEVKLGMVWPPLDRG